MPLAPTSTALMASKPKIGFSIDSIVGDRHAKPPISFSPNSEDSADRQQSPFSDYYGNDLRTHMRIQRDTTDMSPQDTRTIKRPSDLPPDYLRSPSGSYMETTKRDSMLTISNSSNSPTIPRHLHNLSPANMPKVVSQQPPPKSRQTPPPRDKSPPTMNKSRSPSPTCGNRPILVPGIPANLVRPFPVGPPTSMNPEVKTIPPYMNSPEMVTTHPNPHFLAAQFQMAAALAHGQAGQGYPPPGGLPGHHPGHHNIPPREGYPLYPWLLSRHGRIFPHRFPGSKFTQFLLIFIYKKKKD